MMVDTAGISGYDRLGNEMTALFQLYQIVQYYHITITYTIVCLLIHF